MTFFEKEDGDMLSWISNNICKYFKIRILKKAIRKARKNAIRGSYLNERLDGQGEVSVYTLDDYLILLKLVTKKVSPPERREEFIQYAIEHEEAHLKCAKSVYGQKANDYRYGIVFSKGGRVITPFSYYNVLEEVDRAEELIKSAPKALSDYDKAYLNEVRNSSKLIS